MKNRLGAILACAAALLALSPSPASSRQGSGPTVTCSYSNPAYSGYCRETSPIPDGSSAQQVCQDILSCLNNTQCSKTYCNATTIRGGWKLESMKTSSAQP